MMGIYIAIKKNERNRGSPHTKVMEIEDCQDTKKINIFLRVRGIAARFLNLIRGTHLQAKARSIRPALLNKKIGILIAMISLLYFVVVVGFLLPFFAKETTTFKSGSDDFLQNRYSYLGQSYKEIFKTLITQPIYVLKQVLTLSKIRYLFLLFFSLGFGIFSIFAPEILMISLPIFAINLLSEQPMMHQIIYWYNAGIIPFIFISTIYGIPRFINFFNKKIRRIDKNKLLFTIMLTLFFMSILFNYFEGPLPFSRTFTWDLYNVNTDFAKTGHELVKIFPENSSIFAYGWLVPHLIEYDQVYMFPEAYPKRFQQDRTNKTLSFDYIILVNNQDLLHEVKKILPLNDYEKIVNKDGWLVFKNKEIK